MSLSISKSNVLGGEAMSKDKKVQLESQIDGWLQREDEEDEADFRQEWVKKGIELYEQFKMCRLSDQEKA